MIKEMKVVRNKKCYTAIIKGTPARYRLIIFRNKGRIPRQVYIADAKGRYGKQCLLEKIEDFKNDLIKKSYENFE